MSIKWRPKWSNNIWIGWINKSKRSWGLKKSRRRTIRSLWRVCLRMRKLRRGRPRGKKSSRGLTSLDRPPPVCFRTRDSWSSQRIWLWWLLGPTSSPNLFLGCWGPVWWRGSGDLHLWGRPARYPQIIIWLYLTCTRRNSFSKGWGGRRKTY